MDSISLDGHRFDVATATESDVSGLRDLLADDVLGAKRESADDAAYVEAFHEIDADPNQLLLAVRDETGDLVATMQLTLIPGLSRGGAKRLLIEGVRLASSTRGNGLGSALLEWAHEYGRSRGAVLAQLTSDKARVDAHRFYERHCYQDSHIGFKRPL